jgi:hypothetical protein
MLSFWFSYSTATVDEISNGFDCLRRYTGFTFALQILFSSVDVAVAVPLVTLTLVEYRRFLHASSLKSWGGK